MRSGEAFSPFGEFFFSALAQSHQERLAQAVDQTDIASASEADLAGHAARLVAQFAIAALVIDIENASRSERAETATAERFDIYSGRNAGDSYTRQIVTIHVPFNGDPDLFCCQPATRTVCSRPVWLAGDEVCFDIPVPTYGPADIRGEAERMLSCLKENATALAEEIALFNRSLAASATTLLEQKKAEARERARVLDSLAVPLRKADAAAATASPARPRITPSRSHAGIDIFRHVFQVAFSFPGEARHRIGPIASLVQEALGPDSVFYDEWYKAELARPNLDLHLQGIYTHAELIVPCLCDGYERKEWCGLEWRAIRDLIKRRQDRIMLLRLDDADVLGSFSIDGYIDLRAHDDTETSALVVRRVTGTRSEIAPHPAHVFSGPQTDASKPSANIEPPLSLHDCFLHDFGGVQRSGAKWPLLAPPHNFGTTIEWFIMIDLAARSKALEFYIPRSAFTYDICALIAEKYKDALKTGEPGYFTVRAVGETGPERSIDWPFNSAIYVYHEDSLTVHQLSTLTSMFSSKSITVWFRGLDYVTHLNLSRRAKNSL